MNVLIVDDEPLAQEILETYVQKFPNLKLIQKCSNAVEAYEALQANEIDLIFLDIQMPQISGLDFLKTLVNPPKVIFTTAFSEYAVEGYELNIIDYLLKPISFERFAKAVNKATVSEGTNGTLGSKSAQDFMFVKADKKLIKVFFNEIYYIEGLKDYVILHTPKGRLVTLQTMKSLEHKLSDELFMRIHRSYIVNIGHIDILDGNTVIVNKKGIPVGKNYKDNLLSVINKNRL